MCEHILRNAIECVFLEKDGEIDKPSKTLWPFEKQRSSEPNKWKKLAVVALAYGED